MRSATPGADTSALDHVVGSLALPQPLVSQHLRVLKTAGVVYGDRVGREVRYRLVDKHIADVVVAAGTPAAEVR